jgi:hypothetical protein
MTFSALANSQNSEVMDDKIETFLGLGFDLTLQKERTL